MNAALIPASEKTFLTSGNKGEYKLAKLVLPVKNESLQLETVVASPKSRSGYFFTAEHPKKRIVLHYTAGRLESDMSTLTQTNKHISVPYVIARDGTIYQLFSPKQWSGHIGKGLGNEGTANAQDKSSIGIEISNYGFLVEKDGALETIYSRMKNPKTGKPGPVDIYCKKTETQEYTKLPAPFREQTQFANFTEAQYKSLIVLLRYLTAEFNIPRQFLPEAIRFQTTNDVLNFNGIVSHINYRKSGKWDIGPAFDWNKVITGVQAASFSPAADRSFSDAAAAAEENILESEAGMGAFLPAPKDASSEDESYEEPDKSEHELKGAKKLYAVLIGINQYETTIKFGDEEVYFPRLSGCEEDAERMRNYLQADTFYEPDIKVLKNTDATKQSIVQAITEHLGQATENDTALLYFSGHGTQERTQKEIFDTEIDRKLECLVCYYGETTKDDFLLSDKELRWLIHNIATNKPHLVTIFDCCHSGGNTRNAALLSTSFPTSVEKRVAYVFPDRSWDNFIFYQSGKEQFSKERFVQEGIAKLLPEGKHIQLSACESSEVAIEINKEGVFTKTLLQVLKDSGGDLTYFSLGSRIRQYMRNVFAQKPKIEFVAGDPDDLNTIFLNKPLNQSKKAFGEVTYNEEAGWQLNLGAINGIGKNTTQLELIDSTDKSRKIKAAIDSVGIDYTVLIPEEPLDESKIYITNVEGLTSETLVVHFDMEEGALQEQESIFNRLIKEFPGLLLPEEEEQKAQYVLRCRNNQYYLTLPGDEYRPLVKPVPAGQQNTAATLAGYLKHIGQWEFLKNLENEDPSTSLSDEVLKIEFAVGMNESQYQTARDGQEITIPCEFIEQKWQNGLRVRMTNVGEKNLYCACLYLNARFGASAQFLDPKVAFLEGSTQKKAGSPPDEVTLQFDGEKILPIKVNKVVKWYNWPEQVEYLKFIVSTEPFDVNAIELHKLDPPDVPGAQRRGIADNIDADEASPNPTGWFTMQIKLVFPNPQYNVIAEPELQLMLNYPHTSDFALGMYFDANTEGFSPVYTLKPDIKIASKATKGLGSDKIIDVANWLARRKRNRHFQDAVKQFPTRVKIVSEGDSWFQHPLVLDIIDHLHRVYNIYCVSAAGDTLRNYFSNEKANGEYYMDALNKYNPSFFLISGGGNDILGSQFSSYLKDNPGHDYPEGEQPWRFLKDELITEISTLAGFYKTLFAHLETHKPGLNIIVHGYDYPVKLNDAKKGWLGKYMIAKGIDRAGDRKAIIRYIMDEYNDRLRDACQGFTKVTYIDTRNIVRFDEAEKVDQWYDEIHPTNDGFQQIAMKFMETINSIVKKG